jgi:Tfp pilus assembly protein PilF
VTGAILLGLSLFSGPDPEAITERPKVSIRLLSAAEPANGEGTRLRDTLTAALSRFQTLRLASTDVSEDDRAAAQAGQAAADPSGQYVVALKYNAGPAGQSVWWQVIDRANSEALRTGIEEIPKGTQAGSDPLDAIVARLAMRLAGDKGIFNTVLTAAELKRPTLGNGCILRASLALERADAQELGVARSCLEQTIALQPGDADAHAMLAVLLLKQLPSGASAASVEQASGLARQAVALAPDSASAVSAQMLAEFRSGDTEAAIMTGRRAMELNPYDTAIAMRLGTILFLTGNWNDGMPLLRQVGEQEAARLYDTDATLAFDAYRRGQFDEAFRRLRSGNSDAQSMR